MTGDYWRDLGWATNGKWRTATNARRRRISLGEWQTVGSRKRRREGERRRDGGISSGEDSRRPGTYCFRCLSSGHRSWDCRGPIICRFCRGMGHRAAGCPRRRVVSPPQAAARVARPRAFISWRSSTLGLK
ncbi:hypothetical protein QJS04_geneDACA017954 [Acorus gramineus]|uniref:CCHC-type domain-containing protein n=1 Tax=Acorus gramineus TaxID=55184 RepID=A0AAV9A4N7_ACOGR|nr:hypothetical protein QJS04_geneDACA017954 [Acorus gramineus]